MAIVQTVTGPISPDALGQTLIHEHVMVGWPGWESDTLNPGPTRDEAVARGVDIVQELMDMGVKSMVDPCPNDLGRDLTVMAEISVRTGFQIVAATGLYKEDQGGGAYWKFRAQFGAGAESIAEMYIKELTEGVGPTGIKPGIIKVATGVPAITDYELMLLEAAATASKETGAPILTHTDEGLLGDRQVEVLTGHGVAPQRIIVGHSCGTSDHDYHCKLADAGAYLGFDRFGIELIRPDSERIDAFVKLVESGHDAHLVVSHDSIFCWRGTPIPDPEMYAAVTEIWNPMHFHRRIVPQLKERGVTDAQIARVLEENPARYFRGDPIPRA